jgi:CRISP-associated protein Cas1
MKSSAPSRLESSADVPALLPVRMLNEYAYCPRLGYLMWAQGEFADNAFTEDGRFTHRRVDAKDDGLPDADVEGEDAPSVSRSVMLSSESLGLVAKIDLVEVSGDGAVPVDYKRGKKPDVPEGAYEPERVQVCAQGILLREAGYVCDHGILYFAASRERVEIPFDDTLIARTRSLAEEFRAVAASERVPPPLEDSPKCNGCSLVGICLPDEIGMLMEPKTAQRKEPRRLIPARDDAMPVYVQAHGAYVSKHGDVLVIKERGKKVAEAKLFETSQLAVMGNAQVTTQTVQELCRRGIPIVYSSSGGWYYGMTLGPMHKNVELRLHQYRAADDPARSLELSRRFVATKIANCRTLLRRNARDVGNEPLRRLKEATAEALNCPSVEGLLGVEGNAARIYFGEFHKMLKQEGIGSDFDFNGRNRRPPRDPVNALLSFAYALLTKDLTVTLAAAGFDPHLGFYHKPRYGRPSLALDLMEEFRPLVADSTVIGVINNGVVKIEDFVKAGNGVNLKPPARRAFIQAYERRMDQLIRHPVFGYQISYRRVLDVQARLLGRHLSGEIPSYPEFTTR